jgi:hypothetical protein
MNYIREIWLPNREQTKVFKEIFMVLLCALHFFLSVMPNRSIEANFTLYSSQHFTEIRLAPDHLERYYCVSRGDVCEESNTLTILSSSSNYFNNRNYIVVR